MIHPVLGARHQGLAETRAPLANDDTDLGPGWNGDVLQHGKAV